MMNEKLTGGSPSNINMHIPEPIPPAIHTTSAKSNRMNYNNIMSKIDNALSISRKDSQSNYHMSIDRRNDTNVKGSPLRNKSPTHLMRRD